MGGGASKGKKAAEPPKRRGGRRDSVSAASDAIAYEKVVVTKSAEAYTRIENAVADNFLFSALDAAQKQEIYDAMFEKAVTAGEVVINQGADGDFFYIVDAGEFAVTTTATGADKPVFRYSAGGSFGELALMYNAPRAATVTATADGVLWGLNRDTFHHVIVATNKLKARLEETVLQQVALFAELSEAQRAAIADAVTRVEFGAGATIVKEGASGAASEAKFYIVETGEVVVSKKGHGELGTLGPAQCFGEHAIIHGGARTATVKAKGPASCAAMTSADFERLLAAPCRRLMDEQIARYTM